MMDSSTSKWHGLDHLRALAISYVFLFHYFILSGGQPGWLPGFAAFGWTGVDLFFVLSGFLISAQLFAQIQNTGSLALKPFFAKRIFRIIPAYLFTVALYFLWPIFREKESLPSLWKFVTFTQNLGLDLQHFGTFSHAWSLCVEEHFYLLLPLGLTVLLALRRFRRAYVWLIVLCVLGFVLRYLGFRFGYVPHQTANNSWMYWYKFVYYPTYNRLDGLLVGVALAAVYQFRPTFWQKVSRFPNTFMGVGLVLLVASAILCDDQQNFYASLFGFPMVSVGYGCWVVAAISPSSWLYRWKSRVTASVAIWSYAIYLTHKGVIHLMREALSGIAVDENLVLILSAAACVGAAILVRVVVEQPFLRIRDRLLH